MKIQDIMTETVNACRPDANLAEAVAILWEGDCGTLPVVADGGRLVGILTDRDIAIALGTQNKRPSDIQVSEVMSGEVSACRPDEDIHGALKTMRKDKVRRLPVISDDGVLQGIVSLNDVALHAEKVDAQKATALSYEDVVNTFKAICEHRRPKEAGELSSKTAAQ
jgi:CBS domain-containing protein